MAIFEKTHIEGLVVVTPKVFADERGFFLESYKKSEFVANGICEDFVQDNHSRSKKDVLRGLHYQEEPFAQGKLVRCIYGEIFDVVVDIRTSSPTYKQWFGLVLSAENHKILYIPNGFAHGFLTLSPWAEILYKTTSEYTPNAEGGIIWNDPDIGIDWGIEKPILSEKDAILKVIGER